MRRTLLLVSGILLLIILAATLAQAQYRVTGKITDQETGNAVPYANVALYAQGEEAVTKGGISGEQGRFTLKNVPAGSYRLAIRFVGYAPQTISGIQINQDTDVGTIELAKEATELDAVVVEGAEVRQPIETTLEGMTIRPEQNISNVGGSVLDVLRNTPLGERGTGWHTDAAGQQLDQRADQRTQLGHYRRPVADSGQRDQEH